LHNHKTITTFGYKKTVSLQKEMSDIQLDDTFQDIFQMFLLNAFTVTIALSWNAAIESVLTRWNVKEGGSILTAILLTVVISIFVVSLKRKKMYVPRLFPSSSA